MSKELTEKITCSTDEWKHPITKQFVFCFRDGQKAVFKTDKDCQTMQDFLDRMNRVHDLEKKLEIATKALKEYANCKPTEWMSCVTADIALKEMEGVK